MTIIVIGALVTVSIRLVKGLEYLKIRGQVKIFQTICIIKIDQNTEKGPGDLRKFAVVKTPVRNYQQMKVW